MGKEITIQELINHDMREYEMVSSMLSKTVHDVNNPLAVFIGQLSILDLLKKKDQLTPEKLDKVISRFKSSTVTFGTRLELLRNYYKVLLNESDFSKLANIITSVTYYLENDAYKNGINLTHNYETEEEIELQAPSSHIFLVAKHLLQNSLDSLLRQNKEGGGAIELLCDIQPDSVKMTVTDTGPGLICELNMAMEQGYTTNKDGKGGYGLTIIKDILDQHGLKLIYDKSDKCTFSVTWPRK